MNPTTQPDVSAATNAAMKVLKQLMQANPEACRDLLSHAVDIDLASLKAVPVVIPRTKGTKAKVSVIGLINGILGQINGDKDRVAMVVDSGEVVDFVPLHITK